MSEIRDLKQQHSETIYKHYFPQWQGNGKKVICFAHDDKNPSLSIFQRGGEYRHRCFGCGVSGDVLDLIGSFENMPDARHRIGRLKELAGINGDKKKQGSRSLADIQKVVPNGKYKFERYHIYKAGKPPYIKVIFKDATGDKKGLFYTATDNGLYVSGRQSAPVFYNQERITDTIKIVFLSESEKDCNKLDDMGLPCLSSGGATSWNDKLPIEILKDKSIILLPHNDEPGAKYVETAARSLSRKAASIRIINPETWGAHKGADVSDWIQARKVREVPEEEIKAELEEIVKAASEQNHQSAFTPKDEGISADNNDRPYYFTNDTGLWRKKAGKPVEKLGNFDAWIKKEVLIDDGKNLEQFFEIEGKQGNIPLKSIQIKTATFQNMSWVIENWGNQAVIEAGQAKRDLIRHYIQTQSGNVPRQIIYCHTGWREISGKWVYLSSNGAIGGDANICVDLHRKHLSENYVLPLLPENESEAIKTSLLLLDVGDRRLTIPLYTLVFLSAVTTLLKPMPMFSGGFLYGESGAKKTSLACLFASHFGDITPERLINFESTANSIIAKMSILKDCLMILDDLRPTHNRQDAEKNEAIAQRTIRLAGNRSTRERLNPDSTLKQSIEPKGMILITGEDIVKLSSTLARTMVLEIKHGDINLEKLTNLQLKTSLLPHAMTSFLLWIKNNMREVQDSFYPQFIKLRDKAATNNVHGKLIEQICYLQYAMTLITAWLCNTGTYSNSQASELQQETWQILNNQVKRQSQIMEHGDPLNTFFEMFETWITQGKVRLEDKNGMPDIILGSIGGEFLGYYDDFHFYLFPSALWNYLQRYCIAQGEHFPFSRHTFYKMLKNKKLIDTDKDQNTKTERLKGKPQKVLKIIKKDVYVKNSVTIVTGGTDD